MRARELAAVSTAVLAMMLAGARPAACQDVASLPDGADEGGYALRMHLPEVPPPGEVALWRDLDRTGSILTGPPLPHDVPEALSFEESVPRAGDKSLEPVVAAPSSPTPAVAPALAATPTPATPTLTTPLVAGVAADPSGLDASSLAPALAAFPGDLPAGEGPALVAERRAQRDAIAAFYATRAGAPLWIAGGVLTPAARSVLARLDHATEDGLDLARFAVPVPRAGDSATLARAELALSEAALAYARQATGARVNPARVSGLIDLRPDVADAARVLGTVPGAADAGEALRGFNPPLPGYAALRDKLADLRQSTPTILQSRIPAGPVLKPGMSDARVPLIRARFGLDVAADEAGVPPLVYDTRVAAAVAQFQRAQGLPASGLLTARTVAALSGGNPVALENTILANMEMWRWMPREVAPDRIAVNIPEYKARVFRDGALVHEARVVVGQPDKPTPVFAETMRFIIVNPYWNVPLSIIKTEMLPKLQQDPDYFANHGYEVIERNGVTYVRQPPGEGNALGRIKFMFPNSHAVYLHDTNARSYFARDMRALSHGCVRVDQPFSFAEAVMGRANGWPEARIRKLIGGDERTLNLPKPLPILISYFTATVDDTLGFQLRDDVYGYAGRVKQALGLLG